MLRRINTLEGSLEMTYPQWWERLVAGIIDGIIMAIVVFILNLILVGIAGTSVTFIKIMIIISTLISVGVIVAYKVILESSQMQATVGKLVFGIKVVDGAGQRLTPKQALMRTWPWWIQLIAILGVVIAGTLLNVLVMLALIAIFCTFFMDPVGRCIHDQTANCHVIKAGEGMIKTS